MDVCFGSTFGIVTSSAPVALLRVAALLSGNTFSAQRGQRQQQPQISGIATQTRKNESDESSEESEDLEINRPASHFDASEFKLQQAALDEQPNKRWLHVRLNELSIHELPDTDLQHDVGLVVRLL